MENAFNALKDAPKYASVEQDIRDLVTQKFYPCVAAVQSIAKEDYVIETASGFGTGSSRDQVRAAVLNFLEEWKKRRSTTSVLLIAYPDDVATNEEEFEKAMWNELSSLTSIEERDADWAKGWSQDPNDKHFSLCLGGSAFFVVGLHANSSRKGRVLPYPALIFNVFDQFEDLEEQGAYIPMVEKNRERDKRYSGTVSPMAEEFGDAWESIQFSGRTNDATWKCPFRFSAKP